MCILPNEIITQIVIERTKFSIDTSIDLKKRIMNTFMNLLTQVITFGHPDTFREMDIKQDGIRRVAAGDPALPIRNGINNYKIPETFLVEGKEMKGSDFTDYLVTGKSM